jgi:prepilin-type N-terminal cleavage/methylation domain-containing protein
MRPRRARGFTLVELMIVIGVIVVLAGLLLPAMRGMVTSSQRQATLADMRKIFAACQAYKAEMGEFPLTPARARWFPDPQRNFENVWENAAGAEVPANTAAARPVNAALLNNRALVKALGENQYLPPSKDFLARGGIPALAATAYGGGTPVGAATQVYAGGMFLDHWANPILYIHLAAENMEVNTGGSAVCGVHSAVRNICLPGSCADCEKGACGHGWKAKKENYLAMSKPRYHGQASRPRYPDPDQPGKPLLDEPRIFNNPDPADPTTPNNDQFNPHPLRDRDQDDPDYNTADGVNLVTARGWDNAFGRGRDVRNHASSSVYVNMHKSAFAPAWPGMDYRCPEPSSAPWRAPEGFWTPEAERNEALRRRLSEFPELWSAGPDGNFSFDQRFGELRTGDVAPGDLGNRNRPADAGTIAGSFYDRAIRANADNIAFNAPWSADKEGLMPWE